MSRQRRARRDHEPIYRRALSHAGVALLVVRLAIYYVEGQPASIERVSDMDVALLCKLVYRDPRDPHTTARANAPDTCPVYTGGLTDD